MCFISESGGFFYSHFFNIIFKSMQGPDSTVFHKNSSNMKLLHQHFVDLENILRFEERTISGSWLVCAALATSNLDIIFRSNISRFDAYVNNSRHKKLCSNYFTITTNSSQ